MSSAWLRRCCEFQLFALVFALPFEYYIAGREQSLLTSLKLQIVALLATWACLRLAEWADRGGSPAQALRELFPGRLALPLAFFVLIGLLSATLAPEFRGNALRSGIKAVAGALLALAVADLCRTPRARCSPIRGVLLALALAGSCTALLGLGDLAGFRFFSRLVNVFQPNKYFLGDHLRFVSTMEYPNTAGSILLVSICATLALTVFPNRVENHPAWKYAALVMLGTQGVALALTYSRGALGATIVAVVVATWCTRNLPWTGRGKLALAGCLVILLGGTAYLISVRYQSAGDVSPAVKRIAYYGLEAGKSIETLVPGQCYRQRIALQNKSPNEWRCGEYGIGYRWHRVDGNQGSAPQVGAEFSRDLPPASTAEVPVALNTPADPGEYLLIWFVFRNAGTLEELKESYSPAILCVIDPAPSGAGAPAPSETARRYLGAINEERRSLNGTLVPGRWELWSAALRMFRERPLLGIGPDNFRLLKWKHMEVPKGDETILANSIYLELLSGTGILGLASFLWLLWAAGRCALAEIRSGGPSSGFVSGYFGIAYLAGLMSHGFVDYFLKFTPTFLVFWLVLGLLCARTGAAKEGHSANRL